MIYLQFTIFKALSCNVRGGNFLYTKRVIESEFLAERWRGIHFPYELSKVEAERWSSPRAQYMHTVRAQNDGRCPMVHTFEKDILSWTKCDWPPTVAYVLSMRN